MINNKHLAVPYLKAGDTVGIFSPAKYIDKQKVYDAVALLKAWGLQVELGKHVFDTYHQFAGHDADRATDLQSFINNSNIKAIICARGGYGSIRTLDFVDFTPLLNNPKWLVGYSDVTVYHTLLNCKYGIPTIHGEMPLHFPSAATDTQATQTLRQALFGTLKNYSLPAHPLNRKGSVTGKLIGGNLSLIQSVAATPADIVTDGAILFIEEISEYLYHIDRMMMNLKYSGKLKKLKAIIVGGMTDIMDNSTPFGKTVNELILDYATEAALPAVFDFPAGHQEVNLALYLGKNISLQIDDIKTEISFL